MAKKFMKDAKTWLIVREMQTKTTNSHSVSCIECTIITISTNNNCAEGV